MKTRILLAVALLMAVAIIGCKDEDNNFNNEFTLSTEEVAFDGNTLTFGAERQTITINMDMPTVGKWNAICPIEDLWCTIIRSGNKLLVTVVLNNTGAVRSTWIEFSLGDNIQRVNVNQDYLRILSFSGSSITVGASRHGESIPLTTNIPPEKLSASVTAPAGCDWITDLSVNSSALAFNISRNTSTIDTRAATISVTGDGETASLVVIQSALSGYPYVIDLSGANFSDCFIYEIWDDDHNIKIGELCKEYLRKGLDASEVVRIKAIVAYPMASGNVDLTSGLVLDNGYFVGWNSNPSASAPSEILASYTFGETVGTMPTVIYLDEGASRMTTREIDADPGDCVYATLKPYRLRDQRSGSANNVSETQEDYIYNIVKVGTQYWIAENLKTTRYRDGDNIPTNIASADWQLTPGAPGCAVGWNFGCTVPGSSYTNNNANAAAAQPYRDLYGVLYNFNAVIKQSATAGVEMTGLQDMISPAGWTVPSKAQLEMLRNYASQTTTVSIVVPELDALGAAPWGNATGMGLIGGFMRAQNGGGTAATQLISMDYRFDGAQANSYFHHTYFALYMAGVTAATGASTSSFGVGNGASHLANGYYAVRAANYVRCIRQ